MGAAALKCLAPLRSSALACLDAPLPSAAARQAIEAELASLRAQTEKLSQLADEREARLLEQKEALAAAHARSEQLQSECAAAVSERDALRAQLDQLTADVNELEDVAAAAKMENAMLHAERGQLRHELVKLGSSGATQVPLTPERDSLRRSSNCNPAAASAAGE